MSEGFPEIKRFHILTPLSPLVLELNLTVFNRARSFFSTLSKHRRLLTLLLEMNPKPYTYQIYFRALSLDSYIFFYFCFQVGISLLFKLDVNSKPCLTFWVAGVYRSTLLFLVRIVFSLKSFVCTCLWVYMHIHMYTWKSKVTVRGLPYMFSTTEKGI